MNRFITLILILLMLPALVTPGMDVFELGKVPAMIQDYQMHHELEGISLGAYLELHYGSSDHRNTHKGNLPFMNCHCTPLNCIVQPAFTFSLSPPLPLRQFVVFYQEQKLPFFVHSFFQPPQV